MGAVQFENAVLNRDLAQTDLVGEALHGLAAGLKLQLQAIERRRFGGPELRLAAMTNSSSHGHRPGQRELKFLGTPCRRETEFARHVCRRAGDDIELQFRRAVGLERGARGVVLEMGCGQGKQRHVAIDAGERPAIIGVELIAFAPRGDAHGDDVLRIARQQRVGDVERDRVVAAGPFADRACR